IDMQDIPDQVTTLAVLALFADSTTKMYNIEHLKYKESDRIKSLITELIKIGATIDYSNKVLNIYPLVENPHCVELETYDDHRLVMAFHILKAVFPYIRISGIDAVDKSYPNFSRDFHRICNNS
ncbi:MAG: 3-phosphoshikimate 1-carboxyvinyltransferase, partial [Candidatus Cloacimonetes bacterium]|nr:3-phosphoshikimate 1-carboxyvinyltransferase [Candidatus Cloacimonadota bacterium]